MSVCLIFRQKDKTIEKSSNDLEEVKSLGEAQCD